MEQVVGTCWEYITEKSIMQNYVSGLLDCRLIFSLSFGQWPFVFKKLICSELKLKFTSNTIFESEHTKTNITTSQTRPCQDMRKSFDQHIVDFA